MIRWGTVVLVLTATPSHALLQCIYYDQDVAAAVTVVQVDALKVAAPDAGGYCLVSGEAARVFTGSVAVGDWVDVQVPCDNVQQMVGPMLWTDVAALGAAKVIELHLGVGGGVAGYGAGVALLDDLTDTPAWKPLCGEQ